MFKKEERETDFIQYLDPSVKGWAEKWMAERKFGCLLSLITENSIEGQLSQAEECFNKWKIKIGLSNVSCQRVERMNTSGFQQPDLAQKVSKEEITSSSKVISEDIISVSGKGKKHRKAHRRDKKKKKKGLVYTVLNR